MNRLMLLLISFSLCSCWKYWNPPAFEEKMVIGYTPVYSQDSSILQIKAIAAQPVIKPGKIYVRGNMLFQNEYGKGIHVIDKSDPSNPSRIGFIKIHGNQEMSIKGNYMYVNAMSDIVTIDIRDWQNVQEVNRIKNVFSVGNSHLSLIPLPETGVYYQCTSFGDGIHTGWKKDSVSTASCYYP